MPVSAPENAYDNPVGQHGAAGRLVPCSTLFEDEAVNA